MFNLNVKYWLNLLILRVVHLVDFEWWRKEADIQCLQALRTLAWVMASNLWAGYWRSTRAGGWRTKGQLFRSTERIKFQRNYAMLRSPAALHTLNNPSTCERKRIRFTRKHRCNAPPWRTMPPNRSTGRSPLLYWWNYKFNRVFLHNTCSVSPGEFRINIRSTLNGLYVLVQHVTSLLKYAACLAWLGFL